MARVALFLVFAGHLCAAERAYELLGRLVPGSPASVSLFGATSPFLAQTSADGQGRFHFRALAPSQYIVAVHISGKGELRQTVDVGPGTADSKGRVSLTLPIADSSLFSPEGEADRAGVSTRELSIPESARREYAEAQNSLGRRQVAEGAAHLERAVTLAPQFSLAWNNLGTIAYQSREFARADECFRNALKANQNSYEPSVNLGGVLLNEEKPDEALTYNRFAVQSRPHDALANSQLGLNYFLLGKLNEAIQYLELAKRLDPGHFSYPQLTLARIHLLRHERSAAVAELLDFLRRHPDARESADVRSQLTVLEKAAREPQAR